MKRISLSLKSLSLQRRMTLTGMASLALGLPALSLGATGAGAVEADRTAIQADYTQINAAFAKHDLSGVMAFYTPDYTETNSDSTTLDRSQTRRHYQDQLSQMQSMQSSYTVLNCSVLPAGVEMEIRVHTEGTGVKHILFATIHGTFTNNLWVRDLWVNTPQGWRLKHRHIFQDETHTHIG